MLGHGAFFFFFCGCPFPSFLSSGFLLKGDENSKIPVSVGLVHRDNSVSWVFGGRGVGEGWER